MKFGRNIYTLIASLSMVPLMGCAQAQTPVQAAPGQQSQAREPNNASQTITASSDTNKPALPSCAEAQKNYPALAGELPKDYPAVHFDKEQLVKTIVEIANNPKVKMDELARIFGLRFVACIQPDYVREGQAPRYRALHVSDGGFPLKPFKKESGMSVYYVFNDVERANITNGTSLSIEMNFDFNEEKTHHKTKMGRYNCVVETDFSEHLKKDWILSAYYGHVGFKEYRRTIEKHEVQFTGRPFRNPDLKRDPRHPDPPTPVCITSISLLIQPVK
jgi:opacity protein-like surface antigen